ncbi:hypothetical protein F4778DRAFT_788098 [Xylariomycetidae sp. FL2044]|nr:hypothetical protein F4778DRAFT_788098 [Xylariomycetidae sp. FL2044]
MTTESLSALRPPVPFAEQTKPPSTGLLRSTLRSVDSTIPNLDDSDSESDDSDDSEEEDESAQDEIWLTKATALCQYLWPSAIEDSISVQFLGQGSFNVVFALSLRIANGDHFEYILRVPVTKSTIPRTAAILDWLAIYTDLKVPEVITWDATDNNPLEHGYMILTRIPGQSLNRVFPKLSQAQKLILAEELANLYLDIESIENPVAGHIKIHSQDFKPGDDLDNRIFVQPFSTDVMEESVNPVNWQNTVGCSALLPIDRLRHDPPYLFVEQIMVSLFERRIYQCLNREKPREYLLRTFEPCNRVIQEMVLQGVFSSVENDVICLNHPDLFPRNIMVDFEPNTSRPFISGILDWDDARFVPQFCGRIPPCWLWRSDLWQSDSDRRSGDGASIDDANEEPLEPEDKEADSPENAEIKRAFEEAVGCAWASEATRKDLTLARKLFGFSHNLVFLSSEERKLEEWIRRWDQMPSSLQAHNITDDSFSVKAAESSRVTEPIIQADVTTAATSDDLLQGTTSSEKSEAIESTSQPLESPELAITDVMADTQDLGDPSSSMLSSEPVPGKDLCTPQQSEVINVEGKDTSDPNATHCQSSLPTADPTNSVRTAEDEILSYLKAMLEAYPSSSISSQNATEAGERILSYLKATLQAYPSSAPSRNNIPEVGENVLAYLKRMLDEYPSSSHPKDRTHTEDKSTH